MTRIPTASYPTCSFCNDPLETADAKTDDDGKTMHEECYILSIIRKSTTSKSPLWLID
jgi:hypothetical protein